MTGLPHDNSALAQIKREMFTTADQLQQPTDLVVQLLVLAELRCMRASCASAPATAQTMVSL